MDKKQIAKEYQEFAYVVSHDLRAPLRQMDGFLSILFEEFDESGIELNDEQKGYKDIVLNSVKRAEELLEKLLEFSRYNTTPLNVEDVDIGNVLKDAVAFATSQRGGAVHVLNIPSSTLKGDKNLLIKAFEHLLDNALKFQPEGQEADVKVEVDALKDTLVVSIKDNGIGINPERLDQAFTILRKANNRYDGYGVGLTFAKKIIELHDGAIAIDTAKGQGTTVRVSLPC